MNNIDLILIELVVICSSPHICNTLQDHTYDEYIAYRDKTRERTIGTDFWESLKNSINDVENDNYVLELKEDCHW